MPRHLHQFDCKPWSTGRHGARLLASEVQFALAAAETDCWLGGAVCGLRPYAQLELRGCRTYPMDALIIKPDFI